MENGRRSRSNEKQLRQLSYTKPKMMQRLLASRLSSVKSFTSSSSPILPRSSPFFPFHKPPISTSSSTFIKQSSSNAFYSSNPISSFAAKTLSNTKSFKLFANPVFSQLCPRVMGASVAGYGVRFFRPGFPNKGFGFKQSSFSSQFGGW